MFCTHGDRIILCIFCDHEERGSSTDFYPSSLSDRIGESSFMLPEYFSRSIDNIPDFFGESFFEKFLHAHFSDEAESLRVSTFSIGKSYLSCEFSSFGFEHSSDGKYRFRELKWCES